MKQILFLLAAINIFSVGSVNAAVETNSPPSARAEIRTPKPPATPRINGPGIFGVRPGNPFLYQIPATGDRPMTFSVSRLPRGLKVDSKTGRISGKLNKTGKHTVTLRAKNARGTSEKKFQIVVDEEISLTPPLGWNSWNCWGPMVDADKVLQSARAMVDSGLINHGWTYINIDDAWQSSKRGGRFKAIQGNEKFPNMQKLCDDIHAMGLKIGIYSTPWVTSYAGYIGGSADTSEGFWPPLNTTNARPRLHGRFSFAENDAKQWAAWGMDYLKYDWNPRSTTPRESSDEFIRHISTMGRALRKSGRDILYSYSNSMPFEEIPEASKWLNAWRTTGDIRDGWWYLVTIGFSQNRWATYARPGHWNDPDMLVVGWVDVGRGRELRPTALTPDEQYTHITLWSLLASPLLIGCDMSRLDEFTLNLLSNDEVLAVNQDSLGKQATVVREEGERITIRRPGREDTRQVYPRQVWARPLEDGSWAVGLFNLGETPANVTVRWSDLKLAGTRHVRDLWRQKNMGRFQNEFSLTIPPHGAEMISIR
jgi:alpha-galactosidase